MIQYIKAELYRASRKKSTYIYFGILTALYISINIFLSTFETADQYLNEGFLIITFVAILVTTHVFKTVYCDDLTSHTLPNVISTGKPQWKILVSKLIVTALYTTLVVVVIGSIFMMIYFFFGGSFTPPEVQILRAILVYGACTFMAMMAYTAIASIFVYAFQSSAISLGVYIILSLSYIEFMISNLASIVPWLKTVDNLMISTRLAELNTLTPLQDTTPYIQFITLVVCYIIGSTFIASVVFKNKDVSV